MLALLAKGGYAKDMHIDTPSIGPGEHSGSMIANELTAEAESGDYATHQETPDSQSPTQDGETKVRFMNIVDVSLQRILSRTVIAQSMGVDSPTLVFEQMKLSGTLADEQYKLSASEARVLATLGQTDPRTFVQWDNFSDVISGAFRLAQNSTRVTLTKTFDGLNEKFGLPVIDTRGERGNRMIRLCPNFLLAPDLPVKAELPSLDEAIARLAIGTVILDHPRIEGRGRPSKRKGGSRASSPLRLKDSVPPSESWSANGACRWLENPSIFFADENDEAAIMQAKVICDGCSIKDECLEYALTNKEEHFIWGGKTATERKNIIKKRRPR